MSITLTYSSSSVTVNYLTAQPIAYDESEVIRGITAKKWTITGLVKPTEWLDLLDVYNAWRDVRILDTNPETSAVVGTTVTFTGNGPDGITWTNVPCWFLSTPTGEAVGAYVNISVEIVDAAEKLEAILKIKSEEGTAESELLPDYGTFNVGGTVVTLKKPVDSYGTGPAIELTVGGNHYVTGPLVVYKIADVEGETDVNGWNDIRDWYESMIVTYPVSASYYPISIPTATAERKIISGVPTDVYTVSIQLGLVL